VPPGHGLVYLAALALGRSSLFRERSRVAVTATVVFGGAWAAGPTSSAPSGSPACSASWPGAATG
jgi:hypothetical protein